MTDVIVTLTFSVHPHKDVSFKESGVVEVVCYSKLNGNVVIAKWSPSTGFRQIDDLVGQLSTANMNIIFKRCMEVSLANITESMKEKEKES